MHTLRPQRETPKRFLTTTLRTARNGGPGRNHRGRVIVLGHALPDFLRWQPDVQLVDPEEVFHIPEAEGGDITVTLHLPTATESALEAVRRLLDAGIGITSPHHLARDRYRIASLEREVTPPRRRGLGGRIASRALDVIVALVGGVLLLPLVAFVALAIWLDDGGPVFFTQARSGRDGHPFRIIKLRTMRRDAESDGPRWASMDDDRVTRVGAVLRRYRIDELPQLVNVLKGEMSLVGPRPERPEWLPLLNSKIPRYDVRHSVRPGMTGWGTVNVGYANSIETKYLQHQYDIFHLANRTIWFDLEILIRTAKLVFTSARHIDHRMT